MEPDDVRLLRSPQARALLASLPPYRDGEALALAERLRRDGHDPRLVAAALTQARLRAGAGARLTPWADRLLLTDDGAQQATRPLVARHRARRFTGAGVGRVADLGCGVGVDALALAEAGLRVHAVERDPATAAVAAANAEELGLAEWVTVVYGDAEDADLTAVDAVFADPARRTGGRRLRDPERWSPPLSWVLALPAPALGVKVAPGLALESVPDDMERELVSVDGDVVEAALYRGPLRTPGVRHRATLLPGGQTVTDRDLPAEPAPVRPVGGYLYEPDGAVIRAGLVGVVADRLGGGLVDPRLAYVTTDDPASTPLARGFAVVEVLPFQLKRLRAALRAHDVGAVEVKTRGSAVDPEQLRRQLRLSGSASMTVLVTRMGSSPVAVLAQPLLRP